MFDRICRLNGIAHRLTAPASPTTTGKVERFHLTLRRELLDGHELFESLAQAQAAVAQINAQIRRSVYPLSAEVRWVARGVRSTGFQLRGVPIRTSRKPTMETRDPHDCIRRNAEAPIVVDKLTFGVCS